MAIFQINRNLMTIIPQIHYTLLFWINFWPQCIILFSLLIVALCFASPTFNYTTKNGVATHSLISTVLKYSKSNRVNLWKSKNMEYITLGIPIWYLVSIIAYRNRGSNGRWAEDRESLAKQGFLRDKMGVSARTAFYSPVQFSVSFSFFRSHPWGYHALSWRLLHAVGAAQKKHSPFDVSH